MRVLGRDKLEAFKKKQPQSRGPLDSRLAEAKDTKWDKWADIKARSPKADWLGDNRVFFDIKSNDFRLAVLVYFRMDRVIIERIGTRAEYDKWRL